MNTGRGLELLRIAGIPIRIDPSWLLIFGLVLWSLSAGYLPGRLPEASTASYWAAGLVATLLFFASIVIYELAHSLVALRAGIPIPEITLFVFGGVSHMAKAPKTPQLELSIAIAGPLTSFALAGLFGAVAQTLPEPSLQRVVIAYLGWINLALGVFNLIPGFPLDGGRVLRALIWWRTGSLRRGTRVASDAGRGFAFVLMGLGALQLFAGSLVGGLWLIFIGMFLRGMASAGYQEMVLRTSLENVDVADVMARQPVTVPPDLGLRALVDRHMLVDGHRGYPVVERDRVLGVIGLEALRGLSPGELEARSVRDAMRPLDASLRIEPEVSLLDALRRLDDEKSSRLLVMEGDRLVGVLTRSGVLRHLEIQQILGARDAA